MLASLRIWMVPFLFGKSMKIKLPEYRSDAIEKSIDCSAEVNKVSLYSPECMLTPADELGFPESVDELDESEDGLGNDREMEFSNSEDFRWSDYQKEAALADWDSSFECRVSRKFPWMPVVYF